MHVTHCAWPRGVVSGAMSLMRKAYSQSVLRGEAFWDRPIRCPECARWVPRRDFTSIFKEDGKRCFRCADGSDDEDNHEGCVMSPVGGLSPVEQKKQKEQKEAQQKKQKKQKEAQQKKQKEAQQKKQKEQKEAQQKTKKKAQQKKQKEAQQEMIRKKPASVTATAKRRAKRRE